jgi:glycosyltransferase involved in cell wall biosynthesis
MPGKVCVITTVHNPFDTRIFHKEIKSLAKAGYAVTLIAQHNKNEVVDGVKIIALPKPKNRISRIFLLSWKAYIIALKQNADIYHFHDPEFLPWANRLKKKIKAKVIYDVHEDYMTSIKQKKYIPFFFRWIFSIIFNYIEKYRSKEMLKILAEKYYQMRFPDGYTILNYPILSEKTEQRKEYKLNIVEENAVIYTGNVSIDRGAFIFPELVKNIKNINVYIVGKCSPEISEQIFVIAENARDRIHIDGDGFIPFEKILSYYKQRKWLAGLAIFPYSEHYYQKELTKFFEYMRYGIPIIASNFPVWKKLIEESECGICVNPSDYKEISQVFEYIINNPAKAKKMGENGKKLIREKYNWEEESKKLIKIYGDLKY